MRFQIPPERSYRFVARQKLLICKDLFSGRTAESAVLCAHWLFSWTHPNLDLFDKTSPGWLWILMTMCAVDVYIVQWGYRSTDGRSLLARCILSLCQLDRKFTTHYMPLRSNPGQVACLSLFHASDSFAKEWQLACNKKITFNIFNWPQAAKLVRSVKTFKRKILSRFRW